MKIAIESSTIAKPKPTGVGYYTRNLLEALLRHDYNNQYELVHFSKSKKLGLLEKRFSNVKEKNVWWFPARVYNASLRTPFGLAYDFISGSYPDVFIYPGFVRWPTIGKSKSIIVVPDMAFVDYPEVVIKRFRWYLRQAVARSVREADRVITISEFTKGQITKHYGLRAKDITVINPSIDHSVYKPQSIEEISKVNSKYGITGKYFLYLGTVEPRKNIAGIIRAFESLPSSLTAEHQLVLAGGKGWYDSEIDRMVASIDPTRLIRTGYVCDNDKPALYSGAVALVYPSFYEGWGMQILEAMACGTPVIASNSSSMPEVGGKATLYVDPNKVSEIADTMNEIATNKTLSRELIKKGLVHVKQFSWDKSATKLVELLEGLS